MLADEGRRACDDQAGRQQRRVIGVHTRRDTLAAAAVNPVGGVLAQTSASANQAGYRRLLQFPVAHVAGRCCWAVEGAGSYGAGLTVFLRAHGERVVEAGRPKRPPRRTGAKTDMLDAVRAAREALARDHPWRLAGVGIGRRCGCCWHPAGRLRRQGRR